MMLNKIPKIVLLIVGLILVLGGGYLIVMGANTTSAVLAGVGFFMALGGALLVYQYIKIRTNTRSVKSQPKVSQDDKNKSIASDTGAPPNSLNVYYDRIDFEYVENPIGMQQRCFNDNKMYFVHKVIDGKHEEFALPDDDKKELYYDPSEFSNVVTMPSNFKYFTWAASTWEKVSGVVLAVIIVALIIGNVAMSGE